MMGSVFVLRAPEDSPAAQVLLCTELDAFVLTRSELLRGLAATKGPVPLPHGVTRDDFMTWMQLDPRNIANDTPAGALCTALRVRRASCSSNDLCS